jgi:hypothetical protein
MRSDLTISKPLDIAINGHASLLEEYTARSIDFGIKLRESVGLKTQSRALTVGFAGRSLRRTGH